MSGKSLGWIKIAVTVTPKDGLNNVRANLKRLEMMIKGFCLHYECHAQSIKFTVAKKTT